MMLLAAVVAIAAYLALAVIGAGGPAAFFSEPPFVVLVIVSVVFAIAAVKSSGNLSAGKREDRSNRWVIVVFGIVGVLLGFVPAYTDRIGFWTLDGDAMRWFGVALYTGGGVLRIWPVFILERHFSGLVAIQPGHRLVTDGIYRRIRHPSYLGLLINGLGWALTFRSLAGVLLMFTLVPVLVARMNAEEALLESEFGEQYAAYRRRTWRLIPGIY
jgi:protein-S-isoprenylcysteine O-methyltransferase Ste14